MTYIPKCTLCGANETELCQEIELLGNLVVFQDHAMVQHNITREAFRASKGEKYQTECQTIYFWELPEGPRVVIDYTILNFIYT